MSELIISQAEEMDRAELGRRFSEKKRLLESLGGKRETKEIFREALREHSSARQGTAEPASIPVAKVSIAPIPADGDTKSKLKSLVDLALAKGIREAVKKAEAETPYLIDALHDELLDHYYEKLVALGRLNPE